MHYKRFFLCSNNNFVRSLFCLHLRLQRINQFLFHLPLSAKFTLYKIDSYLFASYKTEKKRRKAGRRYGKLGLIKETMFTK